jgi:hypothetical protein
MKMNTFLLVLCAVFFTTALITAFAFALFSSNNHGASFFTRFWHNGLLFGCANGVLVAFIFWLTHKIK